MQASLKERRPAQIVLMLAALLLVLVAAPPAARAAQVENVVINEIQVSTASVDWEFIELAGTPGTDLSSLTLLVIESDAGTAMGTIDRALSLAGQTIPDDGYWVGASPAGAAAYGITPDFGFPNDTFENSTTSYLLVTDFTGAQNDDLDVDNDGTLDTTPWTSVVDGITITDGGAGDVAYADVVFGPDGTFLPSGTFRCPNGPGGTFDGNLLNFDTPDGTPGAPNPCDDEPPTEPAVAALSEIRIDQPSTDNDEYFELTGEPGEVLDGLTYIVIGDGTAAQSSGVIEVVVNLSGQVIPASGFFVAAESTFTFGTADMVTNLNFENSDNVTHMLVRDFTGSDGADLDTDDDGVLDVTPWSEVVECVALLTAAASELTYCDTTVGPDGSNVPGHVFKCEDGWRIGNFNGGDDTPGAANACEDEPPPPPLTCGDPATLIHEIQGAGPSSPFVGQQHTIEGIVVGDFQEADGDPFNSDLDGFYLQEEPEDADGNEETSDGIFVFAPGVADVNPGDVVRVTGTVQEFFGMTELTNVTAMEICSTGGPLPDPVPVPTVDTSIFERYEGMLVTFPQELVISEYFNYDRFGEILVCTERLFQPTAVAEPGSPEADAIAAHNASVCITLDDGRSEENPDPAIHPNGAVFALDNSFRGGDIVQGLTGVLDFRFDLYRIQPTAGANYIPQNPRPGAPGDVGGDLQVAAFNVLNYFTTLGSRGADTPEEFQRQQAKIVAALAAIDAEVVGVMEIENNVTAIANLVDALNAAVGAGTYAYIDTGVVGTDEITVGIIYKPGAVTPVGGVAILDDPSFTDPLGTGEQKSRPAVAQTFADAASGATFTVVVNHLKSKGSACGPGDDDPVQGNCNLTRTLGARALVDWLATNPTGDTSGNYLIIGDLNAYDKEDPIDAIRAGADDTLGTGDDYTDLLFEFEGEFAYTYVFDGQLGYLDYALASQPILPFVTGAMAWHINTDEPDIIDYDMTFKKDPQDALFEPNEFRSSDHDPVIVGLSFPTNAPPVCTGAMPSVASLWPANHQFVPVEILGVTDPDGDPVTITITSVFQDEPVLGPGSGNFAPDAQGIGTSVVELRAERAGNGNGRVYHVSFTATDGQGGSCSGVVLVGVPLNQGPNGAPVDDGPLYDAAIIPE